MIKTKAPPSATYPVTRNPLCAGSSCALFLFGVFYVAACSSSETTTFSAGSGGAPSSAAGSMSGSSATVGGEPSVGGVGDAAGGTDNGGSSGVTNTGGSAAGTSGAAGAATAGGGANGSADSSFALAWQDDFDTLDTSKWRLENFTYDGNQATFTPDNAKVSNGALTISLSAAAGGAAKPYLGVEMRSIETLTYGKVSARMRFAKGSGVVSGLVLFYTPFPNCDWNEIDIEHLGKSSSSSQLNAMVYTGIQNPNCTASVSPTQDPLITPLGFDAEADYHLYDIEWTPAGVKYIADGVVLRNWTQNIALLKRAQNILITIWASNSASWAGALGPGSAPTSADLDWIKVYDWKG